MSKPVSSYKVTIAAASAPLVVDAQSFTTDSGILVFFSAASQAVAAFAAGTWVLVEPVPAP